MVTGVGIDIIEIDRIGRALEQLGDRFRNRIFTPLEQQYCEEFRDPVPHYAARFAAKEAAMKALGIGIYSRVPWTDIEIRNLPSGEPTLVLHGRARERARARGSDTYRVSLSHNRTQAVAVVIMEGPGPDL